MKTAELKTKAKENLKGKWGKAVLIMLCYSLIMSLINFVLSKFKNVAEIVSMIINVPIAYGLVVSFMKLIKGEEVSYVEFLIDGFKNFKQTWCIYFRVILKMLVPIIMIIVAILITGGSVGYSMASGVELNYVLIGIAAILITISSIWAAIKGFSYILIWYILYDNPNLTSKEIVEKSEQLMKGNKAKFFWLQLTFIGWSILATLTLGIGMLWLIPYITVTSIMFYKYLNNDNKNENIENNEDNINVID